MSLIALAACARRDLHSELGRVRSWTATATFATGLRGVGATNGAVTTQLLERAESARAKEQTELARLARTDSQRAAARGLLDSLQHAMVRLHQADK